jgi:hypothetical protein
MSIPDTAMEIQTLGRFRISVDGKSVVTEWPNETMKTFFCSLLSPLDLYITWDRICRAALDIPATRSSRYQLEEAFVRPLNRFLIKETGFTPLVVDSEGVRISRTGLNLDALDFYNTVHEGLKLFCSSSHAAAVEKIHQANDLYTGSYLPGMDGKIIRNTRNDLESLYRTTVMDTIAKQHRTGKEFCHDGASIQGCNHE